MPLICYHDKRFGPVRRALIGSAIEIIAEYVADGYDLTLRQLYYQFVARNLLPNTERTYKNLGKVISDARMAGLIDWNAIVDRTRGVTKLSDWNNPAEIVDACASHFRLDLWQKQTTRVEVWVEKEALAGVVERTCQDLRLPSFSCRGYVSQSAQWQAAQRIAGYCEAGQGALILHLGDHDPSGMDMTRDIYDRLSSLAGNQAEHIGSTTCDLCPVDEGGNFTPPEARQIMVCRIGLNMDQVARYGPPPNPAKLTDSRASDYIVRFGYTSWELDALDPRTLDRLIRSYVDQVRDQDQWDEDAACEDDAKALLGAASERWPDVVEMLS
jgi:hypothetical protein